MRPISTVAVAMVLVAVSLLSGCRVPSSPCLVRINGDDDLKSLFTTHFSWHSTKAHDESPGLLLRDGDVILGDSTLLQYFSEDGVDLTLSSNGWSTRVGEQRLSITGSSSEAWGWLKSASDKEVADLD